MSESETIQSSAEEGAGGHGPGFMLGVLLGILAGAAIATLFTPVSGEQARARTREKAPDLWRRRDEVVARARSTWGRMRGKPEPEGPVDRLVKQARDTTKTARSRFREALDAGRAATRDGQEEARRRFETLTGRRR